MKSLITSLASSLAVAAIGVTLIVYSEADDAPGGVLLGILFIVGALVLSVRTAQRRK